MTCADCESPATWVFDDRGALPVPYCDRHLPAYLRPRATQGTLTRAKKEDNPPPLPDPEPFEAPPPLEAQKTARKRKARDEGPEDSDEAGPPST